MDSAANLHIPMHHPVPGEMQRCRICLCETPLILYPCRCRGSVGFHQECFHQLMQHKITDPKKQPEKKDRLWFYKCELCLQLIWFQCDYHIRWTTRLVFLMFIQIFAIFLILGLIAGLVVLTTTVGGFLVALVVCFILGLCICLIGVVNSLCSFIRKALKQESYIENLQIRC